MTSKKKPPVPLALRLEVLDRDRYRCYFCGLKNKASVDLTGSELQIHHILLTGSLPIAVRCDIVENLVTLCSSCHARLHGTLRKLLDYLREPHCHLRLSDAPVASKPKTAR